ncbi:MAG: beta-carotene isomerase domain-containing protein [Cyanobacteria bacterium P01_H01_bin.15]
MANAVGTRTPFSGYDGFVDLSLRIMRGRSAAQQQQVVGRVLRSLVPAPVLWSIRTFFSPTQTVCELNAWFATQMFEWLVGPCEVQSVEVQNPDNTARQQNSLVKIKKCRYLEATDCVGQCINLCKMPTQEFFTKEFGIPVTMNPNFEDYSCDMIFGQNPPTLADDKAGQNPCLQTCQTARPSVSICPQIN